MLRLAARYADLWNVGFLGMPESLVEPMAALHSACADVGRDPASIAMTVLVGVCYPEETKVPPRFGEGGFVTGSAQQLGAVLRGYAHLGVEHVIFDCAPDTAAVHARVAEGLRLFRTGEPAQPPALPTKATRRLWPWRR
jgi:alkanesulfonate monooxygenase SsuD/methylene tetrahydromethanopterin reductase-like flavin-dependent oxidoreductase (luciferase family)